MSCEWVKNREAEVHRAKYKGCGKVKLKDRGFNFNCHIANYINISKYQTISLYQNISASKINITIMGTISEIYHVSCEWVKNREAEVHRAKYKGCGKVVESSTQQWVQLPEIYHGSHFHNN